MKDIKLVLGVVIGCALLVFLMIYGLSRMSGGGVGLKAEVSELLGGALLVKENKDVKATVVVFSDAQCPSCKVADNTLKPLREMQGVKYVYRHFPLTIHANSQVGARAIESARQLGKGWEMIDILFDKQEDWSPEKSPENKFSIYAKSIGLDEKSFMQSLNSESTKATVSADLALGNKLKLPGTPTIFVNGEMVATQFAVERVKQILAQ